MADLKRDPNKLVGLGFYHLNPRWTSFNTFDWMVDRGYINSVIGNLDNLGNVYGATEKMAEVGGQVWLNTPAFYSAKESLSDYMGNMAKKMNSLKEKSVYETIVGFHWDEPLLHKPHTNSDLLAMTKALYEEYGLRNYPVFSSQEVLGQKGNWDDPDGMLILESEATQYLTDIGFDSYGYDYRTPSTQTMQNKLVQMHERFPEITDTASYYRFMFNKLKDRVVNKEAKVWVYPCAYSCYTWAGITSDEDYCIAHLKGMTDLLFEQEHMGGIHLYTFKTWTRSQPSMDVHLDKDNPNRWEKFEQALRDTYDRINNIEVK